MSECEFEADEFQELLKPLSHIQDLTEDSFPLSLTLMRKQKI